MIDIFYIITLIFIINLNFISLIAHIILYPLFMRIVYNRKYLLKDSLFIILFFGGNFVTTGGRKDEEV
jgi:hypothetical protein